MEASSLEVVDVTVVREADLSLPRVNFLELIFHPYDSLEERNEE